MRCLTLGESGRWGVGVMNSEADSNIIGSVSSSEISGSVADNSLVVEESSTSSEIVSFLWELSVVWGWSTSYSGWIIINVSSCSVDPVPDVFPFSDLSFSNWLGVYSRVSPAFYVIV